MRPSQTSCSPTPTGLTIPIPVMTTRFFIIIVVYPCIEIRRPSCAPHTTSMLFPRHSKMSKSRSGFKPKSHPGMFKRRLVNIYCHFAVLPRKMHTIFVAQVPPSSPPVSEAVEPVSIQCFRQYVNKKPIAKTSCVSDYSRFSCATPSTISACTLRARSNSSFYSIK